MGGETAAVLGLFLAAVGISIVGVIGMVFLALKTTQRPSKLVHEHARISQTAELSAHEMPGRSQEIHH